VSEKPQSVFEKPQSVFENPRTHSPAHQTAHTDACKQTELHT
jgi:hypothetical protein